MKRLTLILYLLLTVVLAVATFVESAKGSGFVMEHIYHSVPFVVLWGVLGVLMMVAVWKRKVWRVWPSFLLHVSFGLILVGALTSYLTSKKGMMHLRTDEPTFQYVEEGTRRVLDLPFTLVLDTFYIDYYPGTEAPADYVSIVSVDKNTVDKVQVDKLTRPCGTNPSSTELHTISMNNILTHKGYRFYQSSFDEDGRGAWLSVNYDPWGTGITYAGYFLCIIAMIGLMVHPKGGFRRLLNKAPLNPPRRGRFKHIQLCSLPFCGSWRGLFACALLLVALSFFLVDELSRPCDTNPSSTCQLVNLSTQSAFAQETKSLRIVPLEEAESMKRMQVIYHDRVVPFNTLARDFVRKLYGEDSYEGLTPEQVLLGWQSAMGDELRVMSNELQSTGDGPRAMRELEEKRALVQMLQNGTLIRPLPADGSVEPLSKAKVEAELIYNRIPFTKILFMFNLAMGVLCFIVDKLTRYKLTRTCATNSSSTCQLVNSSTKVFFLFALLFHLTGYLLRWYIGGRIPLSNGPETMLFLALCIMVLAWAMRRRFVPALPFGFLLSGFALLVAYLGEMNPQITPLVPVLVSPWLSLHVSVIMMAYALFAFIMLNGVWALCVPREAERLEVYGRLMLYPAVFLLLTGIFMGAVWANVSWGRYWGWDPKEVWALISVMIYALPMHKVPLTLGRGTKSFHVYMVVAFLSILITYFGVNFFLGGMHSYA